MENIVKLLYLVRYKSVMIALSLLRNSSKKKYEFVAAGFKNQNENSFTIIEARLDFVLCVYYK